MTMAMLDEGAADLDALEISEQLAMLGAGLAAGLSAIGQPGYSIFPVPITADGPS